MSTLLLSHPNCLLHDTGPHHPERPDRLRAIEQVLREPKFNGLIRAEAPLADTNVIKRVHSLVFIESLRQAEPKAGELRVMVDSDTPMAHGTFEAALRSCGGAVEAVDQVMSGKVKNAFCATRPPGHHAETQTVMGFCFFSNAAIAAKHARAAYDAERVAVVDFDVHHGNGTQEVFWNEPDLFYASIHQMPLYPGTGALSETGAHNNICNAPLRSGNGGEAAKAAFNDRILPALDAFGFDLLIISAGFDAHRDDPLGGLALVEDDFAWMTHRLVDMAAKRASGRVVSVLEGGYDLGGLAHSAAAHIGVLMEAAS